MPRGNAGPLAGGPRTGRRADPGLGEPPRPVLSSRRGRSARVRHRSDQPTMAATLPGSRLAVLPHTTYDTVLVGRRPKVTAAFGALLKGR